MLGTRLRARNLACPDPLRVTCRLLPVGRGRLISPPFEAHRLSTPRDMPPCSANSALLHQQRRERPGREDGASFVFPAESRSRPDGFSCFWTKRRFATSSASRRLCRVLQRVRRLL